MKAKPQDMDIISADDKWPVHEKIYTAIVGTIMLAALIEWLLWALAFLYCLYKVFRKAEHWTIRILAVIVGTVFLALRCVFVPVMVVTLPLPKAVERMWPEAMVRFLHWFAFWTFAVLLTVPWLFCVYQLVTHSLGRTRRAHEALDDISAPKVVVVMPCYREEPEVLAAALDSVVDRDYPAACIHVFLSFDGEHEDELFLRTIERLGVPLSLEEYPRCIDAAYKGARVTVSRFAHGGKRQCQKLTFQLIDRVYREYLRRNDNLFILFIDSDCVLDRACLHNFIYDMELSPGNRRDMLAMTGIITSTTRRHRHSIITLLQDMEYVHGQLFERTVESGCGAVTCLPGALTMLRFSAFRRMAKYYFADQAEQCEDLFDFAKCHLGEDRWLTHLFMIGAKKRHQIRMCTSAFCKTEAVQTVASLVKQRRRWFLGFVTNEACMLTDWRLWKRYPILILVRFAQNTIRTTALLFLIMVLALATTTKRVADLPIGFMAISLGLNWALMGYFGVRLRRSKLLLYPLMFVLNPLLNWYYMVYGILTAGQRTWGGPRADAATADATTTPREAIEKAARAGDDLNVVPESFSLAASGGGRCSGGRHGDRGDIGGKGVDDALARRRSAVRPPDELNGRFAARHRTADGLYVHPDELAMEPSSLLNAAAVSQPPAPSSAPESDGAQSRDSADSPVASRTAADSVYLPQRVESIMGDEDRRKYEIAQQHHNRQLYNQRQNYQRQREYANHESHGAQTMMDSPSHNGWRSWSSLPWRRTSGTASSQGSLSLDSGTESRNSIVLVSGGVRETEPVSLYNLWII